MGARQIENLFASLPKAARASASFQAAIAEFAASYADQNERDFAALGEAATSGRVLAQRGV